MTDASAYNAAIEAQTLNHFSLDAVLLLVKEGEEKLADFYIGDHGTWAAACSTVNFLVAHRPKSAEYDIFAADPTDETIESLIKIAQGLRAEAFATLEATQAKVDAVASRILDRVPGAPLSDTGIV